MNSVSICIPVYNCDVTGLVEKLVQNSELFRIQYEVIVIDDASDEKYKSSNRSVKSFDKTIYLELEKNIGRSAIRNLFLKHTRFENLLFLDCDSKPSFIKFIYEYVKPPIQKEKVICGGRSYSQKPKKSKYLLRWKYGINRECKAADERAQEPYHSFMTNNFMIKKNVLEAIKFDERLKGYGHEDSLYGYQLMKNKIPIKHIDNPCFHEFNETSDEFLEKTKQGIENLLFIHANLLPNSEFAQTNKLLKTYLKIKREKLTGLLGWLSYPLLPLFAMLFRIGIVHLWSFDAYKLLYLCRIVKTKKTQAAN